jgi:hypothetical protein
MSGGGGEVWAEMSCAGGVDDVVEDGWRWRWRSDAAGEPCTVIGLVGEEPEMSRSDNGNGDDESISTPQHITLFTLDASIEKVEARVVGDVNNNKNHKGKRKNKIHGARNAITSPKIKIRNKKSGRKAKKKEGRGWEECQEEDEDEEAEEEETS